MCRESSPSASSIEDSGPAGKGSTPPSPRCSFRLDIPTCSGSFPCPSPVLPVHSTFNFELLTSYSPLFLISPLLPVACALFGTRQNSISLFTVTSALFPPKHPRWGYLHPSMENQNETASR